MSDIGTRMLDIGTPMSDIGTWMLDTGAEMSDIGTPMLGIISDIRYLYWMSHMISCSSGVILSQTALIVGACNHSNGDCSNQK